jgi:hypothetical protein
VRGIRGRLVIAIIAAVAFGGLPQGAHATFPGENGKIVFSARMVDDGSHEIYTVNPDGTGLTRLTTAPNDDIDPSWSPDGTKIVFASARNTNPNTCSLFCNDIYVMNADGSQQTRLTTTTTDVGEAWPAWSPDGTEIAYGRRNSCCRTDLWVMNADGSNQHELLAPTLSNHAFDPTWSPRGNRLAYDAGGQIGVVRRDASGERILGLGEEPSWSPEDDVVLFHRQNVLGAHSVDDDRLFPFVATGVLSGRSSPVWSPDYESIAVSVWNELSLMRPDGGSDRTVLVTTDWFPILGIDWLAIPRPAAPGYARPMAATPVRVPLVPAFEECTAPDREHGPPLAFPSCGQPKQSSNLLTVGTADSNGQPTRSIGTVTVTTVRGDPTTDMDEADVRIALDITDVRRKSDLSDYTGGLFVPLETRVTDRYNGCCAVGGAQPGTVEEGRTWDAFVAGAPCVATADPDVGATCSVSTTAEAITPGSVLEGRRSMWQLNPIRVYANAAETGPFAVQGVFIP